MSTPMSMNDKFLKNDNDELINEHIYKSLVGSLICLTNIRPHIMHVIIIVFKVYGQANGHYENIEVYKRSQKFLL